MEDQTEQATQAGELSAGNQSCGTAGLSDFDPNSYYRQNALQQACHDLKGESSAEDTVARAKVYFQFLKG